MPHSYALYPMTHPFVMTRPYVPFTLLALPFPCVTVMSPWDLVHISKVHSLYSLVLISQDFLFSCLPLCDVPVGYPLSYLPCLLYALSQLPLTVRS